MATRQTVSCSQVRKLSSASVHTTRHIRRRKNAGGHHRACGTMVLENHVAVLPAWASVRLLTLQQGAFLYRNSRS